MLHQRQPIAVATTAASAAAYPPQFSRLRATYHDPGHAGSMLGGYAGAAHMPMHAQQEHYVLTQPQLSATGFTNANFRRAALERPMLQGPRGTAAQQHQQQHQHHHHHQQLPFRHCYPAMAIPPQMADEDLAELQKLSADFEPEVTGPLVGQRQTSNAIANEYASADPVYQQKTAALPQKYSHYRTVRGDGRCGWRAVGFAFLERLIYIGDGNRFIEQEARIRSLSNVLNAAGFQPMLYEDFADELFGLMRNIGEGLAVGNADAVLLDAFNNEEIQNAVITHLRTLTAAWMKTHPDEYVNYVPDLNIDRYCNESVLPFGSEIDHLGLTALKDVLLAPAGIALEVLYLDRTPGAEVNLHRFDSAAQNPYMAAYVRLLYRPGHYDILYKPEDVPPPIAPVPTYFQFSSHTYNDPVSDLDIPDLMAAIPGMSTIVSPQQGWLSASSYGMSDFFPTPTPAQPCAQPTMSTPVPANTSTATTTTTATTPPQVQPQLQSRTVYVPPPQPATMPPPPNQISQELPLRPVPHGISHASAGFPQLSVSGGPFRPSHWELEPDFAQATSQMPFQTAIFRNSHFNTAHFLNPDFQPEEWSPDAEYVTTSNKSSRHKSCG